MRLEKDSLGELEVPDEAYYGVQTVRCSGNYKIGNHTPVFNTRTARRGH